MMIKFRSLLLAMIAWANLAAPGQSAPTLPGPAEIKDLPEEITKAWMEAGAVPTWLNLNPQRTRIYPYGRLEHALPIFNFRDQPKRDINTLPHPKSPFGVIFRGEAISKKSINHLARFDNLHYLRLHKGKLSNDSHDELLKLKSIRQLDIGSLSTDLGKPVRELNKLPNLKILSIQYLDSSIDLLYELGELSKLESLRIADSKVDINLIREIGKIERLKYLDLTGVEIKNAHLTLLSQSDNFKNLLELGIHGFGIDDSGFECIKKATSLISLSLTGNRYSVDGLIETAKLNALTTIHIAESMLDDYAIKKFYNNNLLYKLDMFKATNCTRPKDNKDVVEIHMSYSNITDLSLKYLSAFTELSDLNLSNTKVTGQGFQDILKLAKVKIVDLRDSAISDQGLHEITKLKSLERLCLAGTKISDEGLAKVDNLDQLVDIELAGTLISDRTLLALNKLSRLKKLDLTNTKITDEGIRAISNCKTLSELNISRTIVSDKGIKDIAKLSNLRRLELWHTSITASGILELVGLKKLIYFDFDPALLDDHLVSKLNESKLFQCSWMAFRDSYQQPAHPLDITAFFLGSTKVTNKIFGELKRFTNLSDIDLSKTQITNDGLADLINFPRLKRLNIYSTTISDDGMMHLAKLTTITELEIGETQVTDKGLKALGKIKQLKYISVTKTHVTNEGVEELKKALPGCTVKVLDPRAKTD